MSSPQLLEDALQALHVSLDWRELRYCAEPLRPVHVRLQAAGLGDGDELGRALLCVLIFLDEAYNGEHYELTQGLNWAHGMLSMKATRALADQLQLMALGRAELAGDGGA